jgi:hypothetical protein
MADVTFTKWWKAREIPLAEVDWRNIRIFCQQDDDPFNWDRCIYIIRLAPPYAIWYGTENITYQSPILYVGSGTISQRWSQHRDWLYELGRAIPGGRYEVWVAKPRVRRNSEVYKDIEADILVKFREKTGCLPLRNRRVEGNPRKHTYEDGFFEGIFKPDRRYQWAMYPLKDQIRKFYDTGMQNS